MQHTLFKCLSKENKIDFFFSLFSFFFFFSFSVFNMQVHAKTSNIMGKIEVVGFFHTVNHNNIKWLLLSWTQGEVKVTLKIFHSLCWLVKNAHLLVCNTLLSHSRSLNIIILHAPTFSITNYMNRQIQSRYNGTKDILNLEVKYMLYWCSAIQYLLHKIEGICNLRPCFFALSITFKCAQLRQCKQWGMCRKERCADYFIFVCVIPCKNRLLYCMVVTK